MWGPSGAGTEDVHNVVQGEAFSALRDKAAEKDIVILRTPLGFALAPAKNGQVVPPEEFAAWPESSSPFPGANRGP